MLIAIICVALTVIGAPAVIAAEMRDRPVRRAERQARQAH